MLANDFQLAFSGICMRPNLMPSHEKLSTPQNSHSCQINARIRKSKERNDLVVDRHFQYVLHILKRADEMVRSRLDALQQSDFLVAQHNGLVAVRTRNDSRGEMV